MALNRPYRKCIYCERTMIMHTETHPTRDHIVPQSKGGVEWAHCCYQCNQIKADMMPLEWQQFREANPAWWTARPVTPPQAFPAREQWPWRDKLQKWCRDNCADAEARKFFP